MITRFEQLVNRATRHLEALHDWRDGLLVKTYWLLALAFAAACLAAALIGIALAVLT